MRGRQVWHFRATARSPGTVRRTNGLSASGSEEAPNGGRRFVSLLPELDGAYVVRLRPLRALCGVELHALTFIERPETGRLDGAVVDKHISAAAIDFNEAEALLAVEPLDSSLCHKHLLASQGRTLRLSTAVRR